MSGPDQHLGRRDQQGAALVHEVEVARVRRRHHRGAQRHGLGHRQPQALGAVQGGVAVDQLHQGQPVARAQVAVPHVDVGPVRGRVDQLLALVGEHVAVDPLQDQAGPVVRTERPRVGLDQAEGVLALDHREEVEREQDREPLVEPQPGAVLVGGLRVVEDQRHGHVGDRDAVRRTEDVAQVLRRPPDLVDPGEARQLSRGEHVGLPVPQADVVVTGQELRTDVLDEVGQLVRGDDDEVEQVRRVDRAARRLGHPAAGAVVGDRRDGDPGGVERRLHPARGDAEAELARQVADQVHPERSWFGDGDDRRAGVRQVREQGERGLALGQPVAPHPPDHVIAVRPSHGGEGLAEVGAGGHDQVRVHRDRGRPLGIGHCQQVQVLPHLPGHVGVGGLGAVGEQRPVPTAQLHGVGHAGHGRSVVVALGPAG